MSIKPKLVSAVNDQIQAEFASAYLYLSMSAWLSENNLHGFAHWMQTQWREETDHAMKLYRFVHDRGGAVTLQTIKAPTEEFKSPLAIFESVLGHERAITQSINDLYELAVNEKDLPLQVVLQWFINEQVEEEAMVEEIIDRLKLIGTDGPSIYLVDRELGSRNADVPGASA